MEWKKIESAPKDGTKILVCIIPKDKKLIHWYWPTSASWRAYHPNAKGKEMFRDESGVKLNPTHWMELLKI